MIITKKALPRRTFLRGLGVTVALPLLDAMVPAAAALVKTAPNPVRRLGFVYLPNGVAMNFTGIDYWTPKSEGRDFELSPILSALAPFRDHMVVVSGLSQAQAQGLGDGNGDHSRSCCSWLNGVKPKKTEGADVRAGTTADQIAAQHLGKETPLPSLELGAVDLDYLVGQCENGYSCAYSSAMAWRTPTTPLPAANNPRVVFERLFGDGGTAEQRLVRLQKDRSILDEITVDMTRLQQTLGPSDRTRLGEYADVIREVERRIQKAEEQTGRSSALPAVLKRPIGIPERFSEHVQLMFDLLWLAYQTDTTRVFTFMLGRELNGRTYPEIGINEPHHGLSHHRDDPAQLAKFAKVNVLQADLFAKFLEKLRATPDGDGSLLDHSLLLYGAGMSNANVHSHMTLPLVLVGGGTGRLKGGRHLAFPPAVETPMTNLLVSMLDKAGVDLERLGDSSGRIDFEGLSGV